MEEVYTAKDVIEEMESNEQKMYDYYKQGRIQIKNSPKGGKFVRVY